MACRARIRIPSIPQARNDLRLDAVANDTAADFFVISDDYYNHSDADRDINCIFPIERLRELAAERVIGVGRAASLQRLHGTHLHSQRGDQ